MRLIRSFVAGFALPVVSLASCGETPLGPEALGLRISATASPAEFRVGESTVVSMTVSNESAVERRVYPFQCNLIEVLDDRRRKVGPRASVCALSSVVRVLAPGERLVFSETWGGEGLQGPSDESPLLPPARYKVRLRVGTESGELATEIPVRIEP